MTQTTEPRAERIARAMYQQTPAYEDSAGTSRREFEWASPQIQDWWRNVARAADAISFAAGWDAAIKALREPSSDLFMATADDFTKLNSAICVAEIHGFLIPWKDGRPPLWHWLRTIADYLASHRPEETLMDHKNIQVE